MIHRFAKVEQSGRTDPWRVPEVTMASLPPIRKAARQRRYSEGKVWYMFEFLGLNSMNGPS